MKRLGVCSLPPVYLLLLQSQRREGRRGNLHARLLGHLHHAGFPGLPLLLLGPALRALLAPFLAAAVPLAVSLTLAPVARPVDVAPGGGTFPPLAAPLLTLALLASLLLALRESHLIVELERELGERILLVRNLPLEVLVVGRGAELLRQRRDVRLERSLLVRLPAPDAAAGERRVLLAVVAASLLERQFAGPGAAEEGRRTAARAGVVGAGPFASLLEVEPRPSIAAVARVAIAPRGEIAGVLLAPAVASLVRALTGPRAARRALVALVAGRRSGSVAKRSPVALLFRRSASASAAPSGRPGAVTKGAPVALG
mmetsp:Transcript_7265/g.28592  ORF Transcript_7265/g.28592 Transcript_7265/m.28592 type:complete len:314 (-) Transcript_7265:1467-2408(-)